MRWRRSIGRGFAASLLVAAVGCSSAAPPSLPQVKSALVEYGNSGSWQADVARVATRAERFVVRHAARVDRPAIVLDIDETSLSNWPQQLDSNFCYVSSAFHEWVLLAQAEALHGVLELYRTASRLGVAVFFISGRHEDQREATARNLREAGFESWAGLDLRPRNDGHASASTFKTAVRRRITEDGYTILVNIGDQASDLAGGYAERSYKLPNPFYEVP